MALNNNDQSKDTNKVDAHPYHKFLELTLEQLFNEPLSLRGLDVDESVLEDDKEDYSFLLDLEFEDLFRTPFSVQRMEEELEKPAAGPKTVPVIGSDENNLVLDQVLTTQVADFLIPTKDLKIKLKEEDTKSEDKPLLPPVIPPQTTSETPVDPNAAHINETLLFITEWTSAQGNLLSKEGVVPGQGAVFSVLGVENDTENDLSESEGTIRVETEYGRLTVDIFTGDYEYWLFDATSIADSAGLGYESIAYEVIYSDESIQSFVLNVVIDLNQAPQANPDEYHFDALAVIDISNAHEGLLANDQDSDNSGQVTDFKWITAINGNPSLVGEPFTLPQGGELQVNYDGTFSFDTDGDFNGLAQGQTQEISFNYTMEDGEGLESTATVTFYIVGAAQPPLIVVPEAPQGMNVLIAPTQQSPRDKSLTTEDVFYDVNPLLGVESHHHHLNYESFIGDVSDSTYEFG